MLDAAEVYFQNYSRITYLIIYIMIKKLIIIAIGGLEIIFPSPTPMISNIYISGSFGSILICAASASLFYIRSSSGGTDIAALIVNKYTKMNIGKALPCTDILIVIVGGIISGFSIAVASVIGGVI